MVHLLNLISIINLESNKRISFGIAQLLHQTVVDTAPHLIFRFVEDFGYFVFLTYH